MFCLQGKYNCHYNLQSDCFAYPCAVNTYAWSLSHGCVMRENAPKDEGFLDLSVGKCVWHGGNHEKAAVICARVHFNSNTRFEQTLDWPSVEENESGFANVEGGPLLTR